MARALPAEGRAKELSVERRMATHEMTTKPPSADRVARWRTQMRAEQRDEFETIAGGAARRARLPDRRRRGRKGDTADRSHAVLMRVGIVSKWFASGQAVVSRQIRSALDDLGHETFILAKQGKGPRAQQERVVDPVWDQPGVTQGSEAADIPARRVPRVGLTATPSRSSSQTKTTSSTRSRALRGDGVRTIGRFVWESFAAADAEPAKAAYDVVYSFTRAEQERYRSSGSRARC